VPPAGELTRVTLTVGCREPTESLTSAGRPCTEGVESWVSLSRLLVVSAVCA
jgi:hypothetical protein